MAEEFTDEAVDVNEAGNEPTFLDYVFEALTALSGGYGSDENAVVDELMRMYPDLDNADNNTAVFNTIDDALKTGELVRPLNSATKLADPTVYQDSVLAVIDKAEGDNFEDIGELLGVKKVNATGSAEDVFAWLEGLKQLIAYGYLEANDKLQVRLSDDAYQFEFGKARPKPRIARSVAGAGTTKAAEAEAGEGKKKKASNPYNIFVKENYAAVKAQNPDLAFGEISALLGQLWNDSPDNPNRGKGPKKAPAKKKAEAPTAPVPTPRPTINRTTAAISRTPARPGVRTAPGPAKRQ